MTVAPVPVLAVAGVDVAAGPNPDGSWSVMALDQTKVKWGRSGVLEQPAPATAQASLFDPTGTWAAGLELVGQPVTLRWVWGGSAHVYFRGRVTDVEVKAKSVRRPDGTDVDGAVVSLTASSVLVDAGNMRPAGGAWPAETFAARRARVAAALAPVVSSIESRPAWDAAPLAAVDELPDAALAAFQELWLNAGADRFTFDPDTQAIGWVGRRTFDPATVAQLVKDGTRIGAYVAGPAVQRQAGDPVEPAVSIQAGLTVYTGSAHKSMDSRITHVQLTYPGLVSQGFTVLTPAAGLNIGVRALDVKTQHTDDSQALAAAHDIGDLVAGEASGWVLDSMRWDTSRTGGGFDTIDQARLLLAGSERTGVFWLAGSDLPLLGILPLFGVMGGTIGTRRGHWVVDWNVAPTSTTTPVVHGVEWDDLDPSLVWDDVPNSNSFHSSVTYEDLGFVSNGTLTIGI